MCLTRFLQRKEILLLSSKISPSLPLLRPYQINQKSLACSRDLWHKLSDKLDGKFIVFKVIMAGSTSVQTLKDSQCQKRSIPSLDFCTHQN